MTTTIDPTVYIDPRPGMKGTDTITEPCDRCGGRGHMKEYAHVSGGVCFECNGSGQQITKVCTLRARTRRHAKAEARWLAEAAQREQNITDYNYRAWLAAETAHHAEQARLTTLVQGFVATPGVKVTDLAGTVTVSYNYDTTNYATGRAETGNLLIITLDDGKVVKFASTGTVAFGYYPSRDADFHRWTVGERVVITSAKVKSHATYKGQDQTVVTHARIKLAS
jgi:hypothetical protein